MRYYKLLTKLGYSKDDSVVGKIYPETLKIDLIYVKDLSNYYPNDWQEVTSAEYYVQEGKLPENYIVECNNAEESSAVLNSNTKDTRSWNFWKYCYTRSVDATGFGITKLLSYCPENYIMFSFEQWDKIVNKTMEEEFVLPENWWIDVTDDNINILKKWWDCPSYNTSHIIGMVKWISSGQIKRGYNLKRVTKVEGSYDFGKEITIEQFIKYVLKQEVMEEKEIIGWKLKEDCKKNSKAAFYICTGYTNDNGIIGDVESLHDIEKLKDAGVLELWFEPVYKEKTLQFGGYDVTFEKVTSGVRITCNGETGTFSQIEAIYNYFKPNSAYFKFGSQEVKSVTYMNGDSWNLDLEHINPIKIKIGCTTGTWKEFTDIYEKAKSML